MNFVIFHSTAQRPLKPAPQFQLLVLPNVVARQVTPLGEHQPSLGLREQSLASRFHRCLFFIVVRHA